MNKITREQVLKANPLSDHLSRIGAKLKGSSRESQTSNRCAAQEHRPDHFCVSIDLVKEIWKCHDCDIGGSVIDWIAIENNSLPEKVYKDLVQAIEGSARPTPPPAAKKADVPGKLAKTYDYTDENGKLIFQVCRMEPKDFLQRHKSKNGEWVWNMKGISRVPFKLPAVLRATQVVICEGEKDAETMETLGFVATTNVGGAGKWLPAYSEFLLGKDIIVIPDNDEAGEEHAEKVKISLMEKVNSLKLCRVPQPYKDATEWRETFPDLESARAAFQTLFEKTPHAIKPLPIYTMAELEAMYVARLQSTLPRTIDLGKFLPSLSKSVRRLSPGDLVVLQADTGVGKSCILQNIARSVRPLPVLFFELELSAERTFERFVQMQENIESNQVEQDYRQQPLIPRWEKFRTLHHILTCSESGLTPERIDAYIGRSELKFGMKPAVVIVDYIGIVGSGGRSRYEAVSYAAEQLKIIAKKTDTIIFVGSQVGRPDKKRESLKVKLHDAKDSGSVENSCGLMLGAWRPDPKTIIINVLKCTDGETGAEIECDFDGARMTIKERTELKYAKTDNSED